MALDITDETEMFGETSWVKGGRTQILGEDELAEVEAKLSVREELPIRTIATTEGEWGEHQPLVESLRKALFADYPAVLANEIKPNPPIRGEHCEGRIFLKPDAKPKKQRDMHMNGERLTALEKSTDDWSKAQKIEPANGPWSSPCFPVARTGKAWRGVIDLRYMNDQCLEDSYPLPRIDATCW